MIRKRDFILYLCVLIFVLIAAVYTGLVDVKNKEFLGFSLPNFSDTTEQEFTAEVPEEKLNRESYILNLKQKLALSGDTYADEIDLSNIEPPEVIPEENDEVFVGDRAVNYCNVAATSPAITSWPALVLVQEVEGVRQGFSTITKEITIGTTTSTTEEKQLVFELPVRQVGIGYTTCLPDTLVGVTTNGQPLLNNNAANYQGLGETTLIGYSRDGFIIYGPTKDDDTLDECGGRLQGGVYSYHLRTDESFILACYVGIPTPI